MFLSCVVSIMSQLFPLSTVFKYVAGKVLLPGCKQVTAVGRHIDVCGLWQCCLITELHAMKTYFEPHTHALEYL